MSSTEITAEDAAILYLQNYVDLTENFPNDMARLISEIHMIDVKRNRYVKLLDVYKTKYFENEKNEEKEKILDKIENVLLELVKESDLKLEVARSMADQIDLKSRQLDASYRLATTLTNNNGSSNSLNQHQVNSSTSGHVYGTSICGNKNSLNSSMRENSNNNNNSSNGRHSPAFNHHQNKDNKHDTNNSKEGNGKRIRRGSHKNHNSTNNEFNLDGNEDQRSSTPNDRGTSNNTSAANSNSKRTSNSNAVTNNKRSLKGSNKGEKRGKASYNNNNDDDDSYNYDDNYDPNEPTYCLCEQVSYGEMILCDNPNCKIEWFHFACVSLNNKPKGRWFCPNCRGDRSNIQKK